MPSATIDFDVTNECAGGGHYDLTVNKNATPLDTKRYYIMDLKSLAQNNDAVQGAIEMLLEVIRTVNPSTKVELKNLIETMTITVSW